MWLCVCLCERESGSGVERDEGGVESAEPHQAIARLRESDREELRELLVAGIVPRQARLNAHGLSDHASAVLRVKKKNERGWWSPGTKFSRETVILETGQIVHFWWGVVTRDMLMDISTSRCSIPRLPTTNNT